MAVTTFDVLVPPGPVFCLLIAAMLLVMYPFTGTEKQVPPGPKQLPFIGNVHQLPAIDQHKAFMRWGRQYGDIVYVKFFQQPVIILNSARAAFDLMEKRGVKYSGRPRMIYFNELVEWNAGGGFMQYNDTWKLHRKWFQHALIAGVALGRYQPLQRREVSKLLLDIIRDPAKFNSHLKRYTAAIILDIAYGRKITALDDDLIQLVEKGIGATLEGAGAGSSMVDFFPVLRYLPSWFPGAEFKRTAARGRHAARELEDTPYQRVREEMVAGTARPSVTKDLVEEYQAAGTLTAEREAQIKATAGVLYVGGTDTSLTAMSAFVLEMVLHPEILRKAQEEMDSVIGNTRLPDYNDRPSLPYLECILREVYRIWPAGLLGLPHQATEDDVYRGFHIQKGTTVIANIWAMTRDPDYFEDPDEFSPERYLKFDVNEHECGDPKQFIFGFGRRVCPGRYLADNTIWLAIASLIATMDIRKARDENGVEITPIPIFLSGTVSHPAPFPCDIQPRSERCKDMVLEVCKAHDVFNEPESMHGVLNEFKT